MDGCNAVPPRAAACCRLTQIISHHLPITNATNPSHEDFWPRPTEWLPERWLPANAPTMAPHADKAFMPFSGTDIFVL